MPLIGQLYNWSDYGIRLRIKLTKCFRRKVNYRRESDRFADASEVLTYVFEHLDEVLLVDWLLRWYWCFQASFKSVTMRLKELLPAL